MVDILITISVDDDEAALFAGRDMVVMPLSNSEAEQFAGALAGIEEMTRSDLARIAQLIETLEADGSAAISAVDVLRLLVENKRSVLTCIMFVRTMLGRAARVGPAAGNGGPVQ